MNGHFRSMTQMSSRSKKERGHPENVHAKGKSPPYLLHRGSPVHIIDVRSGLAV